jgi:malonate transporter
LFQPLLTFYLLKEVFVVEPLWTAAGTMLAAMPVGINAYIFSRRYECAETVIASSIVMASLLSPITLTWLLWWLDF